MGHHICENLKHVNRVLARLYGHEGEEIIVPDKYSIDEITDWAVELFGGGEEHICSIPIAFCPYCGEELEKPKEDSTRYNPHFWDEECQEALPLHIRMESQHKGLRLDEILAIHAGS